MLDKKSVLVTGSSRGIGRAIALQLAKAGYTLVLHGRTVSESLDSVKQEVESLNATARVLGFDVSDREQTKRILLEDIEEHGSYYGVILNAGVTKDNAFPFMQDEKWDDVLDINLDSFYNVLKPIVEPLILARKGGRIIAMSSVSGLMGNRGQVNYSAAKAGIIGAVKALGYELAKRKITVNCIAPGLIETEMSNEIAKDHIIPLIPMKRSGTADEVAAVATFLLSDSASYITRQVIAVDGGLS